jgi:hypothetical protein
MASLTKTNGVIVDATATVASFIGKSPKFLAVVVKNLSGTAQDLTAEYGVDEAIDIITREVASKATIHAIQADTTGQISYLLEGADGSWTAASLQTAIRALGTVNSVDCSATTVTDVGFKLALS